MTGYYLSVTKLKKKGGGKLFICQFMGCPCSERAFHSGILLIILDAQ